MYSQQVFYCNIFYKIDDMSRNEFQKDPADITKVIESSDIGPVTRNNSGAIYKSRSLSGLIRSAMSTRSLRSQSITSEVSKYHLTLLFT